MCCRHVMWNIHLEVVEEFGTGDAMFAVASVVAFVDGESAG